MLMPTQGYNPNRLNKVVSSSNNLISNQPNLPKLKLLAWLDSPIQANGSAGTGFGVVAKNVLTSLYNTGKYTINQLAINYNGDFVDKSLVPWQLAPAKLLDPADPHGMKMFLRTLSKEDYDLVLVCNDVYVTQEVAAQTTQILQQKSANHQKVPVIIYYYPVDCHVLPHANSFIKLADIPVCYTDHGRFETLLTTPEVKNKLQQIPHGSNPNVFHPLSRDQVNKFKADFLKAGPDTFIVVNVNRNSSRKQIAYSLAAFKEFKKQVPNSKMYIHTAIQDQGGDLALSILDLGLSPKEDIVYPVGYSPSNPVPEEILNAIYNMGDMYLSTHLGEGWGITVTEAMAAGCPVVVPDNTSMPQIVGEKEERGYLYPCKDIIAVDNSGFRKKGYLEDIVSTMMRCYNNKEETAAKVKKARQWTEYNTWERTGKMFIDLFDKAITNKGKENKSVDNIIVSNKECIPGEII